jgi:hypothetical protein
MSDVATIIGNSMTDTCERVWHRLGNNNRGGMEYGTNTTESRSQSDPYFNTDNHDTQP